MNEPTTPVGWPVPSEVGTRLLESGLIDGAESVAAAELMAARPWSVIYGVDIDDGSTTPLRLVVKSIREPHHVRPAEGANHLERLALELQTMTLARARNLPMPKPYGLIPELGAVVMERVRERRIMSSDVPEQRRLDALYQIGRDCRRWHEIDTDVDGAVTSTPTDVVARVRRYEKHLAETGVGPASKTWWPDALLAVASPDPDIALVATHGDLHVGNVWVTQECRPLFVDAALVIAPAINDVSRLSASIRTTRRALLGGRATRSRVERRVRALTDGFGSHDRNLFALFELSIVLEQWSEVRTELGTGGGGWLRSVAVRIVDRMFSTELDRWHDRVDAFSDEAST